MDVVTMNIVESTMLSICREMGITMMKTSYSTIFNESLDFSCAVADANGDMIAVADYCPAQIGGMTLLIKSCIREMADEPVHEGDVIVHNDPYRGGLHTPEHTFFTPIFVDGRFMGYAVAIGHVAEVGGMVPGGFASEATEIFHEGLRVPPVKVKKQGKDVDEVWKLLLANVRTPRYNYGRLSVHDQRLRARRRAHGRGHREVRRASLPRDDRGPHGLFRGPDAGRDRGDPRRHVFLRRLHGGRRDRRAPIPHRCRHGGAGGRDHRRFRPLRRPGERRDQRDPRRHLLRHLQRHAAPARPLDPAQRRLLSAHPRAGAADDCGQRRFPGAGGGRQHGDPRPHLLHGDRGDVPLPAGARVRDRRRHPRQLPLRRPRLRERRVLRLLRPSWSPAEAGAPSPTATPPAIASTATAAPSPVEVYESRYPWLVENLSLTEDSGGAGKYRGGLGSTKTLECTADEITISYMADRHRNAPWGLLGGGSGGSAALLIKKAIETRWMDVCEGYGKVSPSKFGNVSIRRGDRVRLLSGGGGGFGPVAERARGAGGRGRARGLHLVGSRRRSTTATPLRLQSSRARDPASPCAAGGSRPRHPPRSSAARRG